MNKRSIEKFNEWKTKVKSKPLLKKLYKMDGDETAIVNSFFKDLEFGTGGMRGVIGVGTNCINIYNIRRVTEGVALYMKAKGGKSVAICYDSRIKSKEFARTAACVFAAHGIKVNIAAELAPTPFLSFAVRRLSCDMGVMVTASHNPKEYNGYKLYNKYGCQVSGGESDEVTGFIENVDPFEVNTATFNSYLKKELISYIDAWVSGAFLDEVEKQALNEAKPLKIVYTPLNGAGFKMVPQILYERGFEDIIPVEKQSYPSGRFSTCKFPNPEKPEALKLAVEKAKETGADLVLATDPDCDRVGIAVLHNGEYRLLTGNEVGVLLTDYILGTRYARWQLPHGAFIVRTIVSTSLVDKIAAHFGVETRVCLTGFKYIGDIINRCEDKGQANKYIFGFEESYGYLAGTHCRDKDGVVASMLIAEMAAEYKAQDRTLVDQLNIIYDFYGKYEHKNFSLTFSGAAGAARMKELLLKLRNDPFKKLGGGKVTTYIDFLDQHVYDVPPSDVMQFETDQGAVVIIRPSGTEPLVKFYITAAKNEEKNKALFEAVVSDIDKFFG